MYKSARIILSLLLAAVLLPACTRKQGPTPSDTIDTGMGRSSQGSSQRATQGANLDLIPELSTGDFGIDRTLAAGGESDYGIDGPLQARDSAGIENGMFGNKKMVEGIMPSIYFGFDSSSVSAPERAKLQQASDYLMENPGSNLLIEGHCDWYGTSEYNLALGDRRAKSVRKYISTLGVSSSRIETLSKGSLEATSGLSKSQSSQDRRADLIILK